MPQNFSAVFHSINNTASKFLSCFFFFSPLIWDLRNKEEKVVKILKDLTPFAVHLHMHFILIVGLTRLYHDLLLETFVPRYKINPSEISQFFFYFFEGLKSEGHFFLDREKSLVTAKEIEAIIHTPEQVYREINIPGRKKAVYALIYIWTKHLLLIWAPPG